MLRIRALRMFVGGCLALGTAVGQSWVDVMFPPVPTQPQMAFDAGAGEVVLQGRWRWDGATWRELGPGIVPHEAAVMVYDEARSRVLAVSAGTTWELVGSTWRLPAFGAPTSTTHSLAYDRLRGRVVYYGGDDGDTWEYDGVLWNQVTPVNAPSPRGKAAMAYDSARARVVLFGGMRSTTLYDDTWEYDGFIWHPRVLAHQPPPFTSRATMCYDAPRARCVLCGYVGTTLQAWEFDGVDWSQVGVPPLLGAGLGCSYDSRRGRVVLVCSSRSTVDQTVVAEYDGATWEVVTRSPPGVFGNAMAYDLARGRTVMFGGSVAHWAVPGSPLGGPIRSTWELADRAWNEVVLSVNPPGRSNHAMVYDAARGKMMLFGGTAAGDVLLGDTWFYDGSAWTPSSSMTSPSPRAWHAMTYDSARRRVVLFGGAASGPVFGDTWEFDGTNWQQNTTMASPSPRSRHSIVYDSARAKTVLFGGTGVGGTGANLVLGDTWEYDGANWMVLAVTGGPTARSGHTMAFDTAHGLVRLFGSGWVGANTPSDCWSFDGVTWSAGGPIAARELLGNRCMTYDPRRDRMVLFGGHAQPTWFTWMLSGWWTSGVASSAELLPAAVADWARHGVGCPGSAGAPVLDRVGTALPVLGSSFPLQLSSLPLPTGFAYLAIGFGASAWNGGALPQSLGALGMPACDLWIAPEPGIGPVLLHQNGVANYILGIPPVTALTGVRVAAQALVLDAQAPGGFGVVSNAGIATLR